MMELLLLLALALVAVSALLLHRYLRVAAWDRELDQAFGVTAHREISQRRSL
ncbi:MAG TPA: hypothetical protein VLB29_16945 [Nocardioidaceae bacterium]|nr:hypothetical protein [Nocardioidaceae bacterium]